MYEGKMINMIEIKNLSKVYKERVIFENATVTFDEYNSIYCILGESGAGKTTLFQILFGLDQEYSGGYELFGKEAKKITSKEWDRIRSNQLQIVYQDFNLLDHLSVYDNMLFALNEKNSETLERVHTLLQIMDLEKIRNNKVSKISGGEKQRLALARAFVNRPNIVLLDEPTGNLDDKNTETVLRYIAKLKSESTMIIIITHDARVLPYADRCLKIENHKINLLSDSAKDKRKTDNAVSGEQPVKKKVSLIKYIFTSLKANVIDVILANIPIAAVFVIFLCIFSILQGMSVSSMNAFFEGIDENTVYLSSAEYTEQYRQDCKEQGIVPLDDGQRLGFSNEDLAAVKAIDGVKDAILYNGTVSDQYDSEGNGLSLKINKEKLSEEIKQSAGFSKLPEEIEFTFSSLTIPSAYLSHYNPKKITLAAGEYPSEHTNEIMIPDILAEYYGIDWGNPRKTVTLKVIDEEGVLTSSDYVVSGIYETDYQSSGQPQYAFYTPYVQYDFLEQFQTEEQYINYKSQYLLKNDASSLDESVFRSYESYEKALGTNLTEMLIEMEDSASDKQVSQELKKIFPNLKQISQYEFKYGEFQEDYNTIVFRIIVIMSLVACLFGIILVFINKNYIKRRNKEMAILYSLGYSKSQVIRIILGEYVITTCVDFGLAFGILKAAYELILKNQSFGNYIKAVFEWNMIGQSMGYILIITLISIVFSVLGIRKKNLKKYLQ